MSSELILITGPAESGKTWLANCILAKYGNCAKIYDEPTVDREFLKEIRLFKQYQGRVIITTNDDRAVLEKLIPNRIITLAINE